MILNCRLNSYVFFIHLNFYVINSDNILFVFIYLISFKYPGFSGHPVVVRVVLCVLHLGSSSLFFPGLSFLYLSSTYERFIPLSVVGYLGSSSYLRYTFSSFSQYDCT